MIKSNVLHFTKDQVIGLLDIIEREERSISNMEQCLTRRTAMLHRVKSETKINTLTTILEAFT